MTETADKKPHHHGNLREALVLAGVQLLEEGGLDGLTLRRCAALAGVSHAAPAHHFDGLPGLRMAIAEEGFRRFRNYMVDAEVTGEQTDRGRLKSITRGYLDFAHDNRALFHLIFGYELSPGAPAKSPRDAGKESGHFAYEPLRRACAPFVSEDTRAEVIEAQVWSLAHGFASLYLSGRFRDDRGADGLFEAVMSLLDRVGTQGPASGRRAGAATGLGNGGETA